MTTIQINKDFLLTTQQAADILDLHYKRVQRLLHSDDCDFAVRTGNGTQYKHYRVRYGDLEKLQKLHEKTRSIGRKGTGVASRLSAAEARLEELEKQVAELTQVIDEYTAPVVR